MTVAQRDRAFRSLKGLERTGSTSRVLNFAAITSRHAERGGGKLAPLFKARVLGGAVIVKHRLRPHEQGVFGKPRYTATKLVIPFERTDLSLGGRSLFVEQRGWTKLLGGLHGEPAAYPEDVALLQALDDLPSLDPFLVREQLKRRRLMVAADYFVLSEADLEGMRSFVSGELEGLVRLACGTDDVTHETDRLVDAILSGAQDLRLEALRGALHLEEAEYGEGLFCWRGLLYYKWSLQETLPLLEDLMGELAAIRLVGPRPQAVVDQIFELKNRVASGFARRTSQVSEALGEYDQAFALLRDQIEPAAFSRFLIGAPGVFRALGEDMGLLSHAATYWRFRFPASEPLLATPDDLIDILEEFALALD
ncbi:hypothetical protein LJR225_001496 [Phenylobacterium sp. LjRoot225]|uniref:hypothetical protein n=1 Tax=Phenylobacterium sp. LjRoot225 TaxID=3342285 RepID=UPI003ED03353